MHVPPCAMPVLSMFRPAVSTPTSHRFLALVLAALLPTGRRTMTNVRRTGPPQAPGPLSSSHRALSPRQGSTWALARAWMPCLLAHRLPPGAVRLAGEAPVPEQPGPQVFGTGRPREGVRSTPRETA